MTRPTVSQADSWRPDSLRDAADAWDHAAGNLQARVDVLVAGVSASRDFWIGSAADTAHDRAGAVAAEGAAVARSFVTAAVAARDGADQIAAARADVVARVAAARAENFAVGDDGSVGAPDHIPELLIALSGGQPGVARTVLELRATALTEQIVPALDRLGAADADAAHDIEQAFAGPPGPAGNAATVPAGAVPGQLAGSLDSIVAGWPSISQDRIAGEIAAMTTDQRQRLIDEFPKQVGNTDGVPWPMRVAANRVNIAQAVVDERTNLDRPLEDKLRDVMRRSVPTWLPEFGRVALATVDQQDRDAQRRIAFYQSLLGEVTDPAGADRRIPRQILAFAPSRSSLVELNGNLDTATSLAVLVSGLNTTLEGSPANTDTARRFVAAGRGDIAMITYLGGPFPRGELLAGLVDAADPRYALDMAPRLVAFSEDVDRTVDATGRAVPVTYVGHSYGGSILGTAEALGLTADRTLYVEAAGTGVGVDDPGDWHNRNADVLRFSMTAPGDPIEAVQGLPFGPHGADPDEMPGVIRLDTGYYQDGRPMAGPAAHSDVLNEPSDAWRNILAVITGDAVTPHNSR
ncbi:MAG: hypothetical protein JWR37_4676 [Mycobacterium sp.]|nr:hypothetical protein [Mycobacterium sp.]